MLQKVTEKQIETLIEFGIKNGFSFFDFLIKANDGFDLFNPNFRLLYKKRNTIVVSNEDNTILDTLNNIEIITSDEFINSLQIGINKYSNEELINIFGVPFNDMKETDTEEQTINHKSNREWYVRENIRGELGIKLTYRIADHIRNKTLGEFVDKFILEK